jgi:hypothetical protein
MGSLIVGLVILGIVCIVLILILIEEIITKKICNKTKYRIIKGYSETYNTLVYKLQESFLWVFWVTIDEYLIGLNTIEELKREIKRRKNKNKHTKEVIYKE